MKIGSSWAQKDFLQEGEQCLSKFQRYELSRRDHILCHTDSYRKLCLYRVENN